jgi:4-amino-4-deoxy-L-arabinose transferase-like glycosyltransferase
MKEIFSQKFTIGDLIFGTLILFFIVFYFTGIEDVPFHPDESTQIFMSEDVHMFFNHPEKLFWQPENPSDLRQRYRELDAPLTRYLIGVGREAANLPPQESDWNWSLSWQENIDSNAMPNGPSLFASRIAVALFFPLSILGIFLITFEITHSRMASWLSAILFASNALILLHTRRAMAESLLIFFFILSLWLMIKMKEKLWLLGIPIGLAVNAKQTAVPLLAAALVVLLMDYIIPRKNKSIGKLISNYMLFLTSFTVVFFLLNPFVWASPVSAIRDAVKLRGDLTNAQIEITYAVSPEKILSSPSLKFGNFIAQVFIVPAAAADVANYQAEQNSEVTEYFSNSLHNLFRNNLTWGGIYLLFNILGCILIFFDFGKSKLINNKTSTIFMLAFVFQLLFTLMAFQSPFQRYYILIIPFTCIFPSIAVSKTITLFKERKYLQS